MGERKALGKGLEALIPRIETDEGLLTCPIEELKPSRLQPRKAFNEGSLDELAESISEKGVIQPLLVRKTSDGYELVAGERRWRAALKAGIKEVPIRVVDVSDRESLELALIENIQREDLNPLEESEAYKRLIDEFGYSQEEVARRVGKNRTTINNALRLLKLPVEVREQIASGGITAGHARALLTVGDILIQRELCRRIVKQGLSVRETERIAGRLKTRKKDAKGHRREVKEPTLRALEDELKQLLGTKVEIRMKKNSGRIEISFYSIDELERILEILRR